METQKDSIPKWVTKINDIINAKREEEPSQNVCKGNANEKRND
jgi:hypothetical protein